MTQATQAARGAQYAFLHIPKTAGTSFLHAMRTVFPSTCTPFAATFVSESDAAELRRFDVIAGHLSFADYQKYFPAHRPLTILRNPVARCLSWYWYAREIVPASVMTDEVQSAKRLSPEDFFQLDADIIRRNIVNRQTRQLGGHALDFSRDENADLNLAKDHLDAMRWIGDLDTLPADLLRLRALPGFESFPELPRLNEGLTRMDVSPALRSRIEQLNWADMDLYEHYQAKRQERRT